MTQKYVILPFHKPERWQTIVSTLSQKIETPVHLESVINELCDHSTSFFTSYFEVPNKFPTFFTTILPALQRLALELPTACNAGIPLLYAQQEATVLLTQKQIASIMANAFFGTLVSPKEYNYEAQDLNFLDLYRAAGHFGSSRTKLECIFNYFKRLSENEPNGCVSFHRKVLPKENTPQWGNSNLLAPPVNMFCTKEIQDSRSLVHVDFANKYIGGGVLRRGSVQEEILFVIKPECLVSLLLCDKMDTNETVVIKGAERYSKHSGLGNKFLFEGNFIDKTPRDSKGRLRREIVAMDAIPVYSSLLQYTRESIQRELNKAYCGFQGDEEGEEMESGTPEIYKGVVATGHWGCGAFSGSKELKFIQQLMAASQAGKSLEYFSFGDELFTTTSHTVYELLVTKKVTVGELFKVLVTFRANLDKANDSGKEMTLYSLIQDAFSNK